jgi:hypothetical protein
MFIFYSKRIYYKSFIFFSIVSIVQEMFESEQYDNASSIQL